MVKLLILITVLLVTSSSYAQNKDYYYKQASDEFDQENYKNALKVINLAIEKDSSDADCFSLKAETLFRLKQYQESYNTYNEAVSLFPNQWFLYNGRGNLLLSLGKYYNAIDDFTNAYNYAAHDSLKKYAITNRAAAKSYIRDFEGAYKDLMIAYQIDSTEISTLTNLGAICDETGRGDETLKYLLKVLEIDTTYYPAYGNIGFKYQEMGKYKDAIKYFDKVLEFNPKEPLGYSNRSYNKFKLGDLKGAMDDINKSIKLYPSNSYAYRVRALIYIEEKKIDKACKDLQTAVDLGYIVSYGNDVVVLQSKYCLE